MLVVADCHAHLPDIKLGSFLESYKNYAGSFKNFLVISNSVDETTSLQNLKLAGTINGMKAFVGIHPQVFLDAHFPRQQEAIDSKVALIGSALQKATGIGEIGLDHTYGRFEDQLYLYSRMLEIAEKAAVPITIHSRSTLMTSLEVLSSYKLTGAVLFHWFSGTKEELRLVQDRGFFVSFGPAVLYSKRLQLILTSGDIELILAETDSPLQMNSLFDGLEAYPFMISTVLFKMSSILGKRFDEMVSITDDNAKSYLQTQN
ncbi:MAG: TatD family hydrolase [Nitrososphaerales archaeon]